MQWSTVLAALLVVVGTRSSTAKQYRNRELEKELANPKSNLFGRHRAQRWLREQQEQDVDIELQEEDARPDSSHKDRRGLKGHARVSRMTQEFPLEDSEDEAGNGGDIDIDDTFFYEAEGLDYFRKGIDPEFFEWVNPDEIAPGAITCGFLKPELGSLFDEIFPVIRVYVCMKFADTQPASKGNMFIHCGGPSSLSSCLLLGFEDDLGAQNYNDYNILAIDQRGMGRSWPSFVHDECSTNEVVRAENGTIIALLDPPEYSVPPPGYDENATAIDNNDPNVIKWRLQPTKRVNRDCWTCTTCDFFLNATQADGNVTSYHFLEFSGTRQLAEDIERMRIVLNAPLMHVYGISYGTGVFGTYATIFPGSVGLFVLDSCVSPNPDHYHNAYTGAVGFNARIDYIIFSCTARNIQEPGSCPVEDMRKCIGDVSSVLQDQFGLGSGNTDAQAVMRNVVLLLFVNEDRAEEFCAYAADGDAEQLLDLYFELLPSDTAEAEAKQLLYDPESQPTWEDDVFGNPDYALLVSDIPTAFVRAQDRAGPIYDEDRFAREVIEVSEHYTGAGTNEPGSYFFSEYSIGFYWPKAIPVPPIGNPFITGIIVGILYDSNTPYVWSQEMKNGFKNTHLLTSQSIVHGLGGYNEPDCQRHIANYFETGIVGFTDGQVCGADFASEGALGGVFGLL